MATDDDREEGFDPKRRLCPDGSCIGIIGRDGRCTVCGTRDAAAPAAPGQAPSAPPTDPVSHGDARDDREDADDERDESGPAFNPKRRLCSDGACVGVIGRNNRCSVCGRPADS
ncbi:MAG: hypothetical protein JXP73_20355 [Deltaproteobacteria bacterium]|jgi:hypothetical protein|nr:hypothetical protein [Deltaproteobacteria bacterium]